MLTKIFSKPIFKLSVVILMNENLLRTAPVLSKEIKRSFARWTARKPSKVFTPEEISSGSFDSEDFVKSEYTDSKTVEKEILRPGNATEEGEDIHKKESSKIYEKLGKNDFTFSKLMTLVGNRKMRRRHNLIMLEGKRLNLDALQARLKPKKLFFTQNSFLDELNLPADMKVHLYKLPYKTIELWSKLDTPPGIVGFYSIPQEGDITTKDTIPVRVVCDNVRDPGNMGAIIRVAASVGCTQLLLMKGCTDPWDSKVLRCASGGHFHIPIREDLSWQEVEGALDPTESVFLADSNAGREPRASTLPLQLYHQVDYKTPQSVLVVVGGETEGLSREAFSLATHCNASRLYIPLSNCMESLNSGCALSVVLFEIKRQIMLDSKRKSSEDILSSRSSS